jgi:hypothetical protein
MISIITGDIINSRKVKDTKTWMSLLKKALANYGKENKNWEIYRGDSFQLEITDPAEVLTASIFIKSSIKTLKNVDVRIAIGIGSKSFDAEKITESNGEAFELSGHKFETLKKERQNLAIQTRNESFNEEINLLLKLALIAMDNWSTGSAEFVKTILENEKLSQSDIGEILGITQSSVSERYNRAYFYEISELNNYYKKRIKELIANR